MQLRFRAYGSNDNELLLPATLLSGAFEDTYSLNRSGTLLIDFDNSAARFFAASLDYRVFSCRTEPPMAPPELKDIDSRAAAAPTTNLRESSQESSQEGGHESVPIVVHQSVVIRLVDNPSTPVPESAMEIPAAGLTDADTTVIGSLGRETNHHHSASRSRSSSAIKPPREPPQIAFWFAMMLGVMSSLLWLLGTTNSWSNTQRLFTMALQWRS